MDCIHSGHISPPSPRTPSASQSYSIIETAKANGLNPFHSSTSSNTCRMLTSSGIPSTSTTSCHDKVKYISQIQFHKK